MKIPLRPATEADSARIAILLAELGYPADEEDVRGRVRSSLQSPTSRILVAEGEAEVIGCLTAELVPYFPDGSTICRITTVVVSFAHRRQGVGASLLVAAADFAREHHCSGIEITTAERRLDAQRFYEHLGFSRTSLRFFRSL